jgi:hypothetical protein
VAERTLEQRVADLERLLPVQIQGVSRRISQRTASIKADIASLRSQMLAGHGSLDIKLARIESGLGDTDQGIRGLSRDVAEIKQKLVALPRVLAEELARKR